MLVTHVDDKNFGDDFLFAKKSQTEISMMSEVVTEVKMSSTFFEPFLKRIL